MTLKEYMENLKKVAKKNPEALNLKVVTSSDDEGNDFNPVVYAPAMGVLGKFGFTANNKKGNVVCLN